MTVGHLVISQLVYGAGRRADSIQGTGLLKNDSEVR